jgi:HSP20 family protein
LCHSDPERRPGDYYQAWTLDETIDQSKVDAVLRDGVLTLTLDLKEQVKPRTVKIRVT